MAMLLKYSGDDISILPKNGSDFTLEELQEFVGGYIEVINIDKDTIMVLNEEGMMLGLPYNRNASEMRGGPVVGNVVVCDKNMLK